MSNNRPRSIVSGFSIPLFRRIQLLLYLLRRPASTCWLSIINKHRAFYSYASGSVEYKRNISNYISGGNI